MTIKKDYLIVKHNVLNEIRSNSMSLQELRFFSIYLAKINARDASTRVMRFLLSDFQRIMDYGKLNIAQLQHTIDSLLCKVVGVKLENGGFMRFQLFKSGIFSQDDAGNWYIEIDAHDEALPLMFEFKEHYFTYELWNALRLKSANQLRMYEILKQYEHIGERVIAIDELKILLGIELTEYPRYDNFKIRVLEGCKEALTEYTDIKFTYEPTGKKGKGGKIVFLKFAIVYNDNHVDRLSLAEFIDGHGGVNQNDTGLINAGFENERLDFMADACDREFNEAEIQVLYNLIVKIIPPNTGDNWQLDAYGYLKSHYDELKLRATRMKIKSRFGYLKKIIEADLKKNICLNSFG